MATHTTVYEVITRYRDDTVGATSDIERYSRATDRLGLSMRGARRHSSAFFRGLAGAAAFGGVAGLSFAAATAIRRGIGASFENLNTELNSSLQLASQINLAHVFANDPVENFNQSLLRSRGLVRGLVQDAAKLPGETADFIGISRQISGAVFAGGGSLRDVRQLTGRLALAAPAAGATSLEAGRQAMRALLGQASIGDNPLFAMLQSTRLLQGPGGILDTKGFNALTVAQRLDVLNGALARLTDNPMFRESIIRTWDTQLGTLSDNLFGPYGLGGQLMRGPFNSLLDALVSFNATLERITPDIVDSVSALGAGMRAWYNWFPASPMEFPRMVGDLTMFNGPWQAAERAADMERRRRFTARLMGIGEEDDLLEGGRRGNLPVQVQQNFHIKLDLKSDDSPEAIALKLKRGVAKAAEAPTTTRRAVSLLAEYGP